VGIDEYRTSKTCSNCQSCENVFNVKHWKWVKNRKKEKEEPVKYTWKLSKSHEVVRCKNCTITWQRDVNASRNMYDLLNCLIEKQERPMAMNRQRQTKNHSAKPSLDGGSAKRMKPGVHADVNG